MDKLPTRITPCPIAQAVAELRFLPSVPEDAVFGIAYPVFRQDYPNLIKADVLQLPELLRNDPDFEFAAHYQFHSEDYYVQIGPRVFSVVTKGEYRGWTDFRGRISSSFDKVLKLGIHTKLLRASLRYTDFFSTDIFQQSSVKVQMGQTSLIGQETMVRTLIDSGGFQHILQLNNTSAKREKDGVKRGSIIDTDTLCPVTEEIATEPARLEMLNQMHSAGKRLFFESLAPEFLATLQPEY